MIIGAIYGLIGFAFFTGYRFGVKRTEKRRESLYLSFKPR
jgi:hypothetical protein